MGMMHFFNEGMITANHSRDEIRKIRPVHQWNRQILYLFKLIFMHQFVKNELPTVYLSLMFGP